MATDATLVLGVVAWCKGAAAGRDAAGAHAERFAISEGVYVAVGRPVLLPLVVVVWGSVASGWG